VIDLDNLLACLQLNQKELAELVGVSPQFRIMIRPKQKQMRLMWERFLRGGYKKKVQRSNVTPFKIVFCTKQVRHKDTTFYSPITKLSWGNSWGFPFFLNCKIIGGGGTLPFFSPFFNFLSFCPICLSFLGPIHPLNSSGKGKYKSPNALQVD
jgi:hypothetical protein